MLPHLLLTDDLLGLQLGQLTRSFNSLKPTWSSAGTHWLTETMENMFVVKGKKTSFILKVSSFIKA